MDDMESLTIAIETLKIYEKLVIAAKEALVYAEEACDKYHNIVDRIELENIESNMAVRERNKQIRENNERIKNSNDNIRSKKSSRTDRLSIFDPKRK